MRQLLALVLLSALAFSRVSAECNGKTSPTSYVGDVAVEDFAVEMTTSGWISIPEVNLGSAGISFELDVFDTDGTGCLFSFGTPNTANYIEARVNNRVIQFVAGANGAPVATSGVPVFDQARWQHVSFHVDNKAVGANVKIFIDNLQVSPDALIASAVGAINPIALGNRAGAIGKCASVAPVNAVDNFFITSNLRNLDDIQDTLKQFFPVLRENDLVVYFGFNEPSGNAKSLNGLASTNYVEARLGAGATRKLRNAVSTAGMQTTDKFCNYAGSIHLEGSANTVQSAPYYKVAGGGFTNTLDCSGAGDDYGVQINQRWDDNGAIIGMSVYSHIRHRWRVSPGPFLKVEHADWGGWLQMAESIGVIEEDRSTYIIGKDEFQLQIANVGWVRITLDSPTSLSYQYSLATSKCKSAPARNTCSFKVTDRTKYFFSHIAMIEPMGLANVTSGVGGLPATLACPVPTFNGPYPGSPYTYCDRYDSWYNSAGNMQCCTLPDRDYYWCPPKKDKCWNGSYQDSYCCSNFKYERDGDPSSRRLMYCPITQDDCWLGQFVQACCNSDATRYRNGRVHPQCGEVTVNDCWGQQTQNGRTTLTNEDRCCAYNWNSQRGLRYYMDNAALHPACPITYDDCWKAPGTQIYALQSRCCSTAYRYSSSNYRIEACTPSQPECWLWYTTPGYPRQEDTKCCTPDKKFHVNAQGQKIALPWCTITNADCWSGLFDERCCNSDDLKYFRNPDGTTDFTKRIQYCQPTTDDCWGWETNPAKFPTKVEDQRCCEKSPTRYNPNTMARLDYCWPWFEDCWGFYLWNGLRDEDQRCCDVNKGFAVNANERLPYCAPSTPVPPPPPVAPPPPPVLKTDVCDQLKTSNIQKYNTIVATCTALWGSDASALQTCIATMCKNDDPTTPPIPDCRVERMLKAANPNYVLPKACTEGCPNGCYGRGTCNTNTRKCNCNAGWTGADCSVPTNFNKCNLELNNGAIPSTQCQPFPITYQNAGITQLLTRDFSNVTVQYYDMTSHARMRDTVNVYMVKTIDTFEGREEQFHMVILNNDGTGLSGGSYTMDIDFTGGDMSSFKWANLKTGATASRVNNRVTVTAAWTKTQWNGVVLFNITRGASPVFTVTVQPGSSIQQLVIGCRGTTGAFEVNKLPAAEYTAGFDVACSRLNTQCNHDNCKACAADANCGWCVETGSCQPGAPSGPFVGQCFNWRFSFDSNVNRRLTIIPGVPTNPRLVDVYLTSGDSEELPIEVGVTATDPANVVYDLVMFNQFNAETQTNVFEGMRKIVSVMTSWGNAGIALANLHGTAANGYKFVKGLTNPRDFTGIPAHFVSVDSGLATPASGDLDILAAIHQAANPTANVFNTRGGARIVYLFVTSRNYVAKDASFMEQVRLRLLDNNAALVFAVPFNLQASYQALVQQLTIGRVITIDTAFATLADVVPAAFQRAATSIGLTVGSRFGHIDQVEFTARRESFTIDNVRANMRAKFVVPVQDTPSAGRTTELYFPAYGRSTIETVATDAPLGLAAPQVDGFADRHTLIELKGRSFRNLFKVTFELADATYLPANGKLFIAKLDNTGAWVIADDLPNAGEILAAQLPLTIPFDRIFYRPNNALAEGMAYDTVKYRVVDGCTESVAYPINMNMYQNNRPPVAEMPGPRGMEGTPLKITLGYSEPDGDSVTVGVIRGLYDVSEGADRDEFPIGKFCTHTPAWEAGNFDAAGCTALVAPFNLTGQTVIYVPPYYGHSFADPVRRPELLIIPCFSYKVYETSGKMMVSNELDVQIIMDHVNQKPFVWGDPQSEVREDSFKFDWEPVEDAAALDCVARHGGVTCTWDEDFGEEYWWNAGYRYIALGGYDIEYSDLEAQITAVDCPAGAVLTPWYDDSNNIAINTRIPGLKSGQLHNFIKFRPAKESHSTTARPVYCSFSYRVKDTEGAWSNNVATVSIVINDVNKPPRMSKQVLDITTYENRAETFPIDAVDPEGNPFTGHLVACSTKKGVFGICRDYSARCDPVTNSANVQIINCNNLPAGGVQLVKTANAPGDVEFIGVFQAPALSSVSEGLKYESIFVEFRDGSVFTPHQFVVNFNVIKLNTAPKIYLAAADGSEQDAEAYEFPLAMGTAWSGKFRVADLDIGFGAMDLNITVDDTFATSAALDLSAIGRVDGLGKGIRSQNPRSVQFRGSLAAVNKLVNAISVNMNTELIPDSGSATAKIIISVSDNGFTGQCPDAKSFSVRTCALSDKATITVKWAKPGNNNQVTVAASASAAAFAGIAAVAAALLFRKLNQKAETAYEPWTVNDGDDGIIDNPLFESQGTSGDNPLFEGNADDNAKL